MMQTGFLIDEQSRCAKLDAIGEPILKLNAFIKWK
jgi:hypothetical protein